MRYWTSSAATVPTQLASLVLSATLPFATTTAASDVGEAMVQEARLSLVAFECSVLAMDPEAKAKFFQRGLNAGRAYYALAQQNKSAFDQVWKKIPGPYLRLDGPSVDFLVGRLFHAVEEDLFQLEGKADLKNEAFQRSEFRKRNCDVL